MGAAMEMKDRIGSDSCSSAVIARIGADGVGARGVTVTPRRSSKGRTPQECSVARNRNGEAVGPPCLRTANERVLRAVLTYVEKTGFRP